MVVFPFDVTIIWVSFLLSLLFVIALISKCGLLPVYKHQNRRIKLNSRVRKVDISISFIIKRVLVVFRKKPTKEFGNNSLDEDRLTLFSFGTFSF